MRNSSSRGQVTRETSWQEGPIEQLVESAIDGPFGSNLKTEHYVTDPGVRVIRLQNIEVGRFNDIDHAWISEEHYCRLTRHDAKVNDVLVASLGDENHPVARACLCPELSTPAVVKADCFRLRVDLNKAAPGFVMRALNCPATRAGINRIVQGVTRDRINLRNLLCFRLKIPPRPEQRRIVVILDTLDSATRETERVIVKLQKMKHGLLQDLLCRGIAENGNLRDPQRRPSEFQDSALGEIPRAWKPVPLSEIVPKAEYGISTALSDSGNIPVLRMNNLEGGEVDISQLKYSNSSAARLLLLMPGDVLFNRTNSIEHVGRTAIWREQLPVASFASYVVRLVPDLSRLCPEFLNLWLNFQLTQIRIRKWATPGVQQVNISPTNLRRTIMALPGSLAEQREIASIISKHDQRIRAEQCLLKKIHSLGRGLMDDLLMGRVRVPLIVGEAS